MRLSKFCNLVRFNYFNWPNTFPIICKIYIDDTTEHSFKLKIFAKRMMRNKFSFQVLNSSVGVVWMNFCVSFQLHTRKKFFLKHFLVYLNRNVARNVLLCYSSMRCVGNIEIAIYLDNQFFFNYTTAPSIIQLSNVQERWRYKRMIYFHNRNNII